MNKTLFFVLAFILIACSPQVTVTSEVTVTSPPPTETPIPTPTLHPEFIVLQNLIADSGERFTLLPDGTIEEVTVDGGRQTVPNLHVDQNGIINIIFNNEHIIIEQSQISFDDENGLTIEGYKLENGAWVEAISEAMQTFQADFKKYNAPIEQFNVEEKDGNLVVTNAEGEILYQNGSFEPLFLGQLIVENNMCKQTEWTAQQIGPGIPSNDAGGYLKEYSQPLVDAKNIFVKSKLIKNPGLRGRSYYFGQGCWGNVRFGTEGQTDALMLWKNEAGKVLYQHVFLPPKE